MTRRALIGVIGVLGFAASCASSAPLPTSSAVEIHRVPLPMTKAADVLLVIDHSPAMTDADRQNLRANLREFANVLENVSDRSLHIGIISADPADGGLDRVVAGCAPLSASWIVDEQSP